MKMQHLTVIFIIIIMPIVIVFSEYMNTQIKFIKLEETYDYRLLNSTYDSIKSFQINTINTYKFTPETRVKNVDGACNTFFNSLSSSFKFDGYEAGVMKEYVPAIVITMYDGYYIYTPFKNLLTNVEADKVDERYSEGKTITELKPYISYSCRYRNEEQNRDYIITYSLDNYICVDIFGSDSHEKHEGYLMQGITQINNETYKYDGITINKDSDKECLKELLCYGNSNEYKEYYYTVMNGTKFYYGTTNNKGEIIGPGNINESVKENDAIFFIDDSGERVKQVFSPMYNQDDFNLYYNKIKNNYLGFEYYEKAHEFTNWVNNNLNWIDLSNDNIIVNTANYDGYEFENVGKIFDMSSSGKYIQDSNSNFNRHRRDVIRAVITTNLSSAISGYGTYSSKSTDFIMPKISEADWELLENNVCIAAFMQGLPIGNKIYNSYAVVPNNFNKEYISEEDIYIIKNDNTYARPNEKITTLNDSTIKNDLGYYPGMLKVNFEARTNSEKNYYALCYFDNTAGSYKSYLKSYSSLISGTGIESITYSDMYRYMRSRNEDNFREVKKAYYIALGREKMGSYKFTNYID